MIEQLGKGGMGIVYKAFDPLMEREVAIKVLAEQLFDQPEIRARFYREAASVAKLLRKYYHSSPPCRNRRSTIHR
ncbi:MAG: hypothetical protein E2O77_06375 [Caldithrix sp.]|nr:MAG: hypothetical protein E2O77_06375 [Caldithrix sp.]